MLQESAVKISHIGDHFMTKWRRLHSLDCMINFYIYSYYSFKLYTQSLILSKMKTVVEWIHLQRYLLVFVEGMQIHQLLR